MSSGCNSSGLRNWIGILTVVASSVTGGVAYAGDHGRCCKPSADIDKLCADVFPDADGWLIRVRYEVEVEHACAEHGFVLNLTVEDDDAWVCGDGGRALVTPIELRAPVELRGSVAGCKGETEFAGEAEIRLPRGAIHCPRDVTVHGRVTRSGDGCTLDHESDDADYHPPVVIVERAPRVVEVVWPVREVVVVRSRPVEVVKVVRPVEVVRPAAVVEVRRRPTRVFVGARW